MIAKDGTDGISHTIHVAEEDDGELTNFKEYENVLDAMNLPNGSVKFYFEGAEKVVQNGRIVRTTVRGVEDAFRYRCSKCESLESDLISQLDRGDSIVTNCPICGKETKHERRNMDDI
jgi:rubrerythrin